MVSGASVSWVESFLIFSSVLKSLCENTVLSRDLVEKSTSRQSLETVRRLVEKQIVLLEKGGSVGLVELLSSLSCSLEESLLMENRRLLELIEKLSRENPCTEMLRHIHEILLYRRLDSLEQ